MAFEQHVDNLYATCTHIGDKWRRAFDETSKSRIIATNKWAIDCTLATTTWFIAKTCKIR